MRTKNEVDVLRLIFSNNLKRFMNKNNKKMSDLSADLNIAYTTVADWYHGRKYPRMDKVQALADYFGILKSELTEDYLPPDAIPVKNLYRIPIVGTISAGFDDFGNRIQPSKVITATSDTEAEKALIRFYAEREKLAEKRISKPPETLGELYNGFKDNHMSGLRPNTQDFYTQTWERAFESRKKIKLARITPKAIYDILREFDDKPRMRKAVYGMLSTMLKRAVEWGYLDKNPCERVETPKYKAKEKRPYTETELREVIGAIETEELSFQIIFYLAAMLGMRRSEIVGLKWSDIDFDAATIAIVRSAARKAGDGTYTSGTKNERSKRTLYVDEMILNKLKAYRAEQTQRRLKLGSKWIDGDWIFTQWNGSIMDVSTPTKKWNKFLQNNPDLPKTNLHALRHTAATLLIKNNVAVSTVSGLLGHAQTSTTLNIYTHAIEDAKKEAADVMSGIFKNAKSKV